MLAHLEPMPVGLENQVLNLLLVFLLLEAQQHLPSTAVWDLDSGKEARKTRMRLSLLG